jgi:hypothetical protein
VSVAAIDSKSIDLTNEDLIFSGIKVRSNLIIKYYSSHIYIEEEKKVVLTTNSLSSKDYYLYIVSMEEVNYVRCSQSQ